MLSKWWLWKMVWSRKQNQEIILLAFLGKSLVLSYISWRNQVLGTIITTLSGTSLL